MQDRYAFDVGDFGKFGLLRHLIGDDELFSLGVIWYATRLGSHGNDGKHVGYLDLSGSLVSSRSERYRRCDPGLYDRSCVLTRDLRRERLTRDAQMSRSTKRAA